MSTVPVVNIVKALEILSSFNFEGAIAAFKAKDELAQTEDVLLGIEDAAKIAGLFVPEAATAAEWIEVVRVALPILVEVNKHLPGPHQLQPGEYEAFGHVFNGTITQGTFSPEQETNQ